MNKKEINKDKKTRLKTIISVRYSIKEVFKRSVKYFDSKCIKRIYFSLNNNYKGGFQNEIQEVRNYFGSLCFAFNF